MRPFSKYLQKVKAEKHTVQYNLSGTTPPLKHAIRILKLDQVTMELAESRGTASLRDMTEKIAARSGFATENIEFFAGTSQAIFQILAGLTQPGDTVLIETPTYSPVLDIAKFLGLKILRFKRTADFQKDLEDLKKNIKKAKLVFITNPHCPSGRTLSGAEIQQLDKLNKPVILDEIYLPHFAHGKITRVSPRAKNLVSLSGFSKTVGVSSVRLAWALGARKWLQRAALMGFNMVVDLPTPSFVVGNLVLEKWDAIVASIQEVVSTNRKTLLQYKVILGPYLSHSMEFGNFATLQKPIGMKSEAEFIKALGKESLFLRPGSDFEMKNHFRFHLMADPEDFRKALQRIVSFYEI